MNEGAGEWQEARSGGKNWKGKRNEEKKEDLKCKLSLTFQHDKMNIRSLRGTK